MDTVAVETVVVDPPDLDPTAVAPPPAQRPESSTCRVDLPGGLTLAVRPGVVGGACAVACHLRGGSLAEGSRRGTGAAHLVEHAVATRAGRAMVDRGLGVLAEASTAYDHTAYAWRVLPGDVLESLRAFAGSWRPSSALRAELANQRDVVLDEIRLETREPTRRLHALFMAHLFAGHPMGLPICGAAADLEDESAEDTALEYLQRVYLASNLTISVVGGGFDVEELGDQLSALAPILPTGPPVAAPAWTLDPLGDPAAERSPAILEAATAGARELTEMGFATPGARSQDAAALEALAVQLQLEPRGELWRCLQDAAGPCTFRVHHAATDFGIGYFSLAVEHAAGAGDPVRAAVEDWLAGLANGRRPLDLSAVRRLISTSSRRSLSADSQAKLLARGQNLDGPDPVTSIDARSIAEAVEHHAAGDRIVTAVLRRRGGGGRDVTVRGLTSDAAPPPAHRPPRRRNPVADQASLDTTDLGTLRPPGRRQPREIVLGNGLRLLHLPSSSPVATCHVSWAGGALSDPAHAPGRCRVLASSLSSGAVAALGDRAATLATEGALYGYCDDAFFGLSLTLPAGRLRRELDVLASVALRPEFTQDGIDATARAVAEDATLPTSSWRQTAERQLRETLLRAQRPSSAFDVDEIRSAHQQLTAAGNTLVVVAGGSLDDGDLEHLAALFGDARGGPCPRRLASLPTRVATLTGGDYGGWVGLGCSLHGAADAEPAALEVLRAVLVGPASAQSSGRLVEGLRRSARTYDVQCLHQPGCLFALLAAAEPRSHGSVLDHIDRELLRLSEGEIPVQQLQMARKQLTLQHVLLNESPRHLAYFASRFIHATGAASSWTDLVPSLEAVDADAVARLAGRLARSHAAAPEHPQRKNDLGEENAPATR